MQSRQRHTRLIGAMAALAVMVTPAVAAAGGLRNAAADQAGSAASATKHPATPTKLVVKVHHGAPALTWHSNNKTGFQIKQATDAAMNQGVQVYNMRGRGHEFTPFGLTKGQKYYFRVRARSGSAFSKYSNQGAATASSLEQPVRLMTYNLLEATRDGQHEGSGTIAPWDQRRFGAAALIKQANPDIIAVEESAAWIGAGHTTRQADSLVQTLGSPYKLAYTEIPPGHPKFFRVGVNVIYNSSTYQAVGKGGHWHIGTYFGDENWGVYQEFRNRATGARFLFVATHLLLGAGYDRDRGREAETKALLKGGNARAHKRHLPVVYAGDFNSAADPNFKLDGAGVAMRDANVADTFLVGQKITNGQYNSANQYLRRPPKTGDRIDHIFAPPGIGVKSSGLVLDLKHGKFVGVIPSDHNPLIADVFYPY